MNEPDESRQTSQTSQARIDANRENAKKSTGPRSDAGKAASSRNRLIHGLRANKHILLDDDNPEDFLLLLKDLDNTFRPVGEGEEMLVTHIAADMWRLEHALPMEAALFRHRLPGVAAADYHRKRELANQKINHEREPQTYSPAPDPPDPDDRLARAFMIDCAKPNFLASLARYKAAAQLSIDRNLRQLKIYQAARLASPPPQNEPVEQAAPPANPDETPAEPVVTSLESANYHSNPTNSGRSRFSATALLLAILAFLHRVPEILVAQAILPAALTLLSTQASLARLMPRLVSRVDLVIPAVRPHLRIKYVRPVQLHHLPDMSQIVEGGLIQQLRDGDRPQLLMFA